jgi:type VII secretion-associated serine protease mycosin
MGTRIGGALVRRGWPVVAACAAGLVLALTGAPGVFGRPALAGPLTPLTPLAGSAKGPQGVSATPLPGPEPGCPARAGIAAPAGLPWAQQVLAFPAVWPLTRGAGVTVAVVDSGVDANPQFGDRVILGPDLATKNAGHEDQDCVGHGTSVASIIAAAPAAGISFTGVAPAARILSVKISDTDVFSDSVTPEAIRDAVELGASVINLSLATSSDSASLRSAVDFALSRNVVVVAAAGNDNAGNGTGPFYPAAYPGVLSVGAVAPDGSLASFSDTHTPVSVTAPGVDITTAYPGTFPDAYDSAADGTSFAAAFVSGVVALVRAYHPRLDEAQVVARIEATADGPAGPGTGHGLVNPLKAVTAPSQVKARATVTATEAKTSAMHVAQAQPSSRNADNLTLTVSAASFGLMILILAVRTVTRRRPEG